MCHLSGRCEFGGRAARREGEAGVAKKEVAIPIDQVYSEGGSERDEAGDETMYTPNPLQGRATRRNISASYHRRRRSSAYVTHLDPSNFISFTEEDLRSGNHEDDILEYVNETILEVGESEGEEEDSCTGGTRGEEPAWRMLLNDLRVSFSWYWNQHKTGSKDAESARLLRRNGVRGRLQIWARDVAATFGWMRSFKSEQQFIGFVLGVVRFKLWRGEQHAHIDTYPTASGSFIPSHQ